MQKIQRKCAEKEILWSNADDVQNFSVLREVECFAQVLDDVDRITLKLKPCAVRGRRVWD